ncbi:acyl-CoA thioesterase [Parapedomonas caeni]
MARGDFRFSYDKRVRYAEIDAQAVVFNARYLDYVDIGLTEYWREMGIHTLPGPDMVDFQVVKAVVEYKRSIVFDEVIAICMRTSRIGRSSIHTTYEIHGPGGEDLRASGEMIHVHVSPDYSTSQPIPDWVVARIEQFEGRTLRQMEFSA